LPKATAENSIGTNTAASLTTRENALFFIIETFQLTGLIVFLKLDIGVGSLLYIFHDIDDSGSLIGGLVPDRATVIVGNSVTNPGNAAPIR